MHSAREPVYKLKTIEFFKRKVPIVTQNENGPCPLLALANILLLRNHIHLPLNVSEVQQERLISLVAGHILDTNNEKRLEDAGEEYKANLQQNIADAMALLPKLATGVDVNVRFNDIQAFEFTQDTAIFDLLDVRLVHGWLTDPQDTVTQDAVGQHSYNELVSELVNVLGDGTPQHLLTPTVLSAHSRDTSFSGRVSAESCGWQELKLGQAGAPPVRGELWPQAQQAADADADAALTSAMEGTRLDGVDSEKLQQALALSMHAEPPAQADNRMPTSFAASPAASELGSNAPQVAKTAEEVPDGQDIRPGRPSVHGPMQPPEGPTAVDVVVAAQPPQGEDPGDQAEQPSREGKQGPSGKEYGSDWVKVDAEGEGSSQEGTPPPKEASSGRGSGAEEASSSGTSNPVSVEPLRPQEPVPEYDDVALAKGKMVAFADVNPEQYRRQQLEAAGAGVPRGMSSGRDVEAEKSRQCAEELQRVGVVQAFLEGTSSQLTEHGLLSLHQGLRSSELAILFRNNHFNTIFSHNNALWILVTDQGYLYEQKVVWEKLCDVSGDTEFASSNFSGFSGGAVAASSDVTAAADLAQAAFAAVVPPRSPPDAAAEADSDADMALAMQLHEEEVEHQQRIAAAQQAQQPVSKRLSSAQAGRSGQQASGGRGRGGGTPAKKKDKKYCIIM